jgi:hypothetical protein
MRISKRVSEDFEDTKGATKWPKEKIQKDKQRSTKHTYTLDIYTFIKKETQRYSIGQPKSDMFTYT